MFDLAFLDQFSNHSGDLFNRDIGIDSVLIIEVDSLNPQPF